MNFYISFLLFNLIMCVISTNIVTKSGLVPPTSCAVGLKFFAEINNTSGEECTVEVHPDECCLDANDSKCNIIQPIGSATEDIAEGDTSTLELVAPLLDPYDRRGFCTIYVDYRAKSRPKNFVRDTIKIRFDTTLLKTNLPEDADATICKHIDEDPMNDCKPVNCETYYNGMKSYFSMIKKRCIEVPNCEANTDSEIPKTAYNPISNKCVDKPSILKDDIDFIKALTGGKDRPQKDVLIIKMVEKNYSMPDDIDDLDFTTVSRMHDFIPAITPATKKLLFCKKPKLTKGDVRLNCFLKYLSTNRYTLMVLSGVILLQCCLMCTMIYCLTKNCTCCTKKKVIKRFFNYRQDASVTTPLICTSNIDTETTDYQYLSESSNYIDKKIKCYKACQKERKNNIKLSMSDDILSKCLTRRDWHRLPRSETIPEVRNDEEAKSNEKKESVLEHKKAADIKVNFQEESRVMKTKAVKSIVKKIENKNNAGPLNDSSEKIIRCHSYNYNEANANLTGFKHSTHSKNLGLYKQEKTNSIEQGAQAYFSNDSIDDFLSERGVIFIGDNASKYSFTSISSAGKSTATSRSSKTSKNNVVQNVISMLSRKAKGPSSDPGLKKSKPELDLELLHLSRASVCSSSNDTDMGKDLKRIKDSTSSL